VQCTMRTFLLLLSFMMTPRSGTFETNEAGNEATFILVLLAGCAIDAISPTLGSLRSLLGSVLVVCRVHRCEFVMHNARVAGVVKFFMGQQRNRTPLYLKPDGTRRSHKSWNLVRSKKRAPKEERKVKEKAMRIDHFDTVDQRAISETCMEDLQDAIALQKWLGVHILPRVIAIAAFTSKRFCASHLGSDEALEVRCAVSCLHARHAT